MPRFFLHIREGGQVIEDPDGSNFLDLRAARSEAIVAACEIAAERLKHGNAVDGGRFEISDGAGRLLATVPFPLISNSP